jgi:hypothetical protein
MQIVRTSLMEWQNGLEVVEHMTPAFRDNLGPRDKVEDVYRLYNQKTLVHDATTTYRGDLCDLKAGYEDLTNAYHDSVEECFFLTGDCTLSGEGRFVAGDYFWRPPGFVHSAKTDEGFSGLLFLQGESPGDGSGRTSRNIRDVSEAGNNVLEPDLEKAVGPRGWVRVSSKYLPWINGVDYSRSQDSLNGWYADKIDIKVLSSNMHTGAQSILVRFRPGYKEENPSSLGASFGGFVISGEGRIGDEVLEAGTWLSLDSNEQHEPISSENGMTLFCKIDGFLNGRLAT